MRISDDKRYALYEAISEPIMKARITLARTTAKHPEVDDELFALTDEIWKGICKELNVERR